MDSPLLPLPRLLLGSRAQALTSWLREHGVVQMVLKSNMHQAQYADQVGCRWGAIHGMAVVGAVASELRCSRCSGA